MAELSASQLANDMLGAAVEVLKEKGPEARDFATVEIRKLAETLVSIERLYGQSRITKEQAVLLLEMQKNASRAVLHTLEGLGILAAEAAINAALVVVRAAVNRALGFAIL
jgi:hypothetical protein